MKLKCYVIKKEYESLRAAIGIFYCLPSKRERGGIAVCLLFWGFEITWLEKMEGTNA